MDSEPQRPVRPVARQLAYPGQDAVWRQQEGLVGMGGGQVAEVGSVAVRLFDGIEELIDLVDLFR
jgi:hypothetical protein